MGCAIAGSHGRGQVNWLHANASISRLLREGWQAVTELLLPRRKFLTGALAFIAAPAIVRAASLMPIKVQEPLAFDVEPDLIFENHAADAFAYVMQAVKYQAAIDRNLYGQSHVWMGFDRESLQFKNIEPLKINRIIHG